MLLFKEDSPFSQYQEQSRITFRTAVCGLATWFFTISPMIWKEKENHCYLNKTHIGIMHIICSLIKEGEAHHFLTWVCQSSSSGKDWVQNRALLKNCYASSNVQLAWLSIWWSGMLAWGRQICIVLSWCPQLLGSPLLLGESHLCGLIIYVEGSFPDRLLSKDFSCFWNLQKHPCL